MSQRRRPSAPTAPHDPYAPLRIANFRWFVASILTMAMGAQIQGVVVAWQMYDVTRDPLALGMVGLAEAAPFIGLRALRRARRRRARSAAGRADRRWWCCSPARVALAVASACSSRPGRGRAGRGRFAGASTRSSSSAARRAASCCRRATRWAPSWCRARSTRARSPGATGIWQVAAVTGPALGGMLYAWVGPTRVVRDRGGADGGGASCTVAPHPRRRRARRRRAPSAADRQRARGAAPSCSRARSSWAR